MKSNEGKTTNIRLGDYIVRSTANNNNLIYGEELIEGVTSKGMFDKPKGNTMGVDLKPYKIVNNGAFVYNPSRLNLGSIAYRADGLCIVSHLYIIFYLSEEGKKIINPDWLFMYFRRDEFYREVTFRNFGSQRPEFNFNDMSDIIIPLPDIATQQKYVDIYKAMVANQQSYESGLEDLKLVCDGYINGLDNNDYKILKNYIERNIVRNEDGKFSKLEVKGFNNDGEFIKPKRLFSGDVTTFKVIKKDYFVYNSRVNSTIKKLSIALNEGDELIVTPAYESFYVSRPEELDPFYLYMLLQRDKFAKKVLFNSFGSATLFFSFDALEQIKIPVPSIETQRAIANIYRTYKSRCFINESIRSQIKSICSVLIKGSLEEGK